ncbi:MAG: hypothetical protein JWQ73_673 [Variovorax sp.]|jgi:hypothetical protein|nr:hypothetical protein [Variovorax sp.]
MANSRDSGQSDHAAHGHKSCRAITLPSRRPKARSGKQAAEVVEDAAASPGRITEMVTDSARNLSSAMSAPRDFRPKPSRRQLAFVATHAKQSEVVRSQARFLPARPHADPAFPEGFRSWKWPFVGVVLIVERSPRTDVRQNSQHPTVYDTQPCLTTLRDSSDGQCTAVAPNKRLELRVPDLLQLPSSASC